MSDNDLIRRGDALAVVRPTGERPCDCRGCRGSLPTAEDWARWDAFSRAAAAIAALPAAPDPAAIREAALMAAVQGLVEVLDQNETKGPLPDTALMFCWLAAQDVRAVLRGHMLEKPE